MRRLLYPAVVTFLTIVIGLWLYFALNNVEFSYIKGFSFLTIIFCLFVVLVIFLQLKYSSKWLEVSLNTIGIGLCLFLTIVIIFHCVNTINDEYTYTMHSTAYAYSIAQVFGGKTLLIDFTNQYGFYPYFLQPIFNIVGFGVIQITIVLGVLLAGFYAILFFLIKQLIKNRAIAICAFLAMPGAWLWAQYYSAYGPIFQHWPHRVLFPGILLLMVWFYLKARGNIRNLLYYLTFIICGMAVLWNFDTGIVVFVSWLLFLYWETLGQWRTFHIKNITLAMMKHTVSALTIVILSIGWLYLYTFVRSGVFPDMSSLLSYETMRYGSGFAMIPMPLIHPWNLIILTYCIGVYISISHMAQKMVVVNTAEDQTQTSRVGMIFVLSIMGLGLFIYYQGRSADAALLDSFWSAFFLLALFADDLLLHFSINWKKLFSIADKASNIATGFLFLLLSLVLIGYAGGIVELFPDFTNKIQTEIHALGQISQGVSSKYTQNIDFLRKYFSPGDQVVILSWYGQAAYYIESKTTNPLDVPGMNELVLKSDYQKLTNYLMNGTLVNEKNQSVPLKVIMADDFEGESPDLFKLVKENYHMIDRVNDLSLWEKFP
jgi:hypothetical protein